MTAGVKLFLLNCSHFETKVLKLTDFLGEYSSFWRQLFVLHAISDKFLGFNLFKSLMVGEFVILGCLFLVDAFLTGDVFFTHFLTSDSSLFLFLLVSFLPVAASSSSCCLFLPSFLLVVLCCPKSVTVIMTSLLSVFFVSSCQVFSTVVWLVGRILLLTCSAIELASVGWFWLTVSYVGLVGRGLVAIGWGLGADIRPAGCLWLTVSSIGLVGR